MLFHLSVGYLWSIYLNLLPIILNWIVFLHWIILCKICWRNSFIVYKHLKNPGQCDLFDSITSPPIFLEIFFQVAFLSQYMDPMPTCISVSIVTLNLLNKVHCLLWREYVLPPKLYVETLIPNVTIFRDRTFTEISKVKRVHEDEALIYRVNVLYKRDTTARHSGSLL
jgi:hypothetical protein